MPPGEGIENVAPYNMDGLGKVYKRPRGRAVRGPAVRGPVVKGRIDVVSFRYMLTPIILALPSWHKNFKLLLNSTKVIESY